MADKVHPPPSHHNGTTAAPTSNPSFPATKSQLYGATRPTNYRPTPNHHYRRRSHCCSICLWLILILIILLLIFAIAGVVFYLLYKPHRPSFSITSLKISQFNLTTSSSTLQSKLNLTVSARNPNNKLVYMYNLITIAVTTRDGVNVGTGTFPSFVHGKKNTTTLRALIVDEEGKLDDADLAKLKSDLKSKNGVPLKIDLKTKVKVKIGGWETRRVKIRVLCDGVKATVPTGNSSAVASTVGARCKTRLRIKIWKWTI